MEELLKHAWLQGGFAVLGYIISFILLRQLFKTIDANIEQQRKITKVLTLIAERVRVIGVKMGERDDEITIDS